MGDKRESVVSASRCMGCGRVCTPPEPFGCEQCGALPGSFEAIEVELAGVVHSTATVHRHHRPEPPTPFTVVEVVLDAGPALKGVLAVESPNVEIGDRVQGSLQDGLLVLETAAETGS